MSKTTKQKVLRHFLSGSYALADLAPVDPAPATSPAKGARTHLEIVRTSSDYLRWNSEAMDCDLSMEDWARGILCRAAECHETPRHRELPDILEESTTCVPVTVREARAVRRAAGSLPVEVWTHSVLLDALDAAAADKPPFPIPFRFGEFEAWERAAWDADGLTIARWARNLLAEAAESGAPPLVKVVPDFATWNCASIRIPLEEQAAIREAAGDTPVHAWAYALLSAAWKPFHQLPGGAK